MQPSLLFLFLCTVLLMGTGILGQVITERLPAPVASNYTIRFACLNTGVGRFQFYGNVYRNVFRLFQNWVAGKGGISLIPRNAGYKYYLNATSGSASLMYFGDGSMPPVPAPQNVNYLMVPHQVEVVLFEVGADTIYDISSKTALTALQIANGDFDAQFGPFDAIFAPYGSDFTSLVADTIKDRVILAPFTSAQSVFQCSSDQINANKCYNSSSDPPRRYSNVYGTLARAGDYFDLAVQYARFKKAKAIGLICEDSLFGREACEGAKNMSLEMGLTIAKQMTYTDTSVAAMKTAGVDFLVAAVYADTCQKVLQQLSQLNWVPDGSVFSTCVGSPSYLTNYPTATPYTIGPLQWHKRHDDVSYREPDMLVMRGTYNFFMYPSKGANTSAMQFYNAYKTISGGDEPTYHAASALASIYAYHMAALVARTNEVSSTVVGMLRLTRGMGLRTFWGYLGFDSVGMMDQSEDFTLTQYDASNNLQVITPVRIATMDLVYPAPTYPQRVCLAKTVLECSGNGDCQKDGNCKCYAGYSGSVCADKQFLVQTLMQEDGCKGVWIAALVLLIIFLIALGISIFFCCDRAKLKQAKETMERAAAQAAAQLPANIKDALPNLGNLGTGGGGGSGYAGGEKLEENA